MFLLLMPLMDFDFGFTKWVRYKPPSPSHVDMPGWLLEEAENVLYKYIFWIKSGFARL